MPLLVQLRDMLNDAPTPECASNLGTVTSNNEEHLDGKKPS